MKSITAVFAAVMMLFAPAAFAACPDITGPYCLFAGCWYQYEQAPSCAGTSGNVSPTTLWCYNTPALQFGTGSSSATYSFTLGPNDPINNNNWNVDLRYVELSDPNASIYNTLTATVSVNVGRSAPMAMEGALLLHVTVCPAAPQLQPAPVPDT